MLRRIRSRLTYANVMATIAVFVALGGSSYAAIAIKKNSVKSRHIAPNAIKSGKVKNESLRARDFRAGELPAGAQGPQGPQGLRGPQGEQGPPGETGPAGSPDTPAQVRDKLTQVDGDGSSVDADLLDGLSSNAFLPAGAKAADSELLDGQNSSAFLGANAKAADADRLDNIDSTGFVTGGPAMVVGNRLTFDDQFVDPHEVGSVLLNLPFLGQLRVDGCDGTNGRVLFNVNGGTNVYSFNDHLGETNPVILIGANHVGPTVPKAQYIISVARNTGANTRMATIWVAFNGDDCTFQAQALLTHPTS
jgi:hypothetical protein